MRADWRLWRRRRRLFLSRTACGSLTRRRRRARLLLRGFGRLVCELDLTLTEFLHHLPPGLLIFSVVDRRSVEGLGEVGELNREGHGLLLHVHSSDDHPLAFPHFLEHVLRQFDLDLTARQKAGGILQRDWFAIVDLDLHARWDHQRIDGGQPHKQILYVFAFDRAHLGGDQHHSGIWVKHLVIDDTKLLVGSLVVLQAKFNPCHPFRCRSNSRGGRSRGGRGSVQHCSLLSNHQSHAKRQSTCRKRQPRQPGELVPSVIRCVHTRPFFVLVLTRRSTSAVPALSSGSIPELRLGSGCAPLAEVRGSTL